MKHRLSTSARLAARRTALFSVAGLWLALVSLSPAGGQVPADAVLSGFEPTGDFLLEVAGAAVPKAEIYHSDRAGAYLILTSKLSSPVLLNVRAGQVESVHVMKVAKRSDGRIDLLADANLGALGGFRIDGQEVVFSVDDKEVRMKPKPPLTGRRSAEALLDHSPDYSMAMKRFEPIDATVGSLASFAEPVRVQVFFGSWCSVCKRYVPSILKLEEALAGSKISFDYYGLPKPPAAWDDPEVVKLGVKSVPTAVVFVGGSEAGRITGQDWFRPESKLSSILED